MTRLNVGICGRSGSVYDFAEPEVLGSANRIRAQLPVDDITRDALANWCADEENIKRALHLQEVCMACELVTECAYTDQYGRRLCECCAHTLIVLGQGRAMSGYEEVS